MRVCHTRSIRVQAGVRAGVLATVTMDVAMEAASRLGRSAFTSDRLGLVVIGRWTADLMRSARRPLRGRRPLLVVLAWPGSFWRRKLR